MGAAGRRLWSSVVDAFELDEHERVLLVQAARIVDLLDVLDAAVRADGPLVDSPQGGVRAHPAAVESRQQGIALARLLAALRLPAGGEGDQQASARPPRRVGVRGTYGIRGGCVVKRRVVEVNEGLAPPAKLLRYLPAEYQDEAQPYTSAGMTRWLEDRAAWRACSAVPLPGVPSRERAAFWQVEVPADLLAADRDAPRPEPYRNEAS